MTSDRSNQEHPEAWEVRRPRLLSTAHDLKKTPGVYLMKDREGRILYIGKATSLRQRVSSYFQQSGPTDTKTRQLLAQVDSFDSIDCEGEWEALLMESRLIKDVRPRFNIRLLDDKSFPYLAVTTRDDFPGVYITRNPTDERFKGARILGPFTSIGDLRSAVQVLQKVFKFRTCDLEIEEDDPKNRFFRPCLLHSIGQCTAPCANRVDRETYRADIERFLRFLTSKRTTVIRELEGEMTQASLERRYEKAAVIRDQIKAIERLDEREKGSGVSRDWQTEVTLFSGDPSGGLRSLQRTIGLETPIRCIEGIDIAHLAGSDTVGSKVCFIDGRPFKDGYRRYQIKTTNNDDYQSIREVVSRRYRDAGAGKELYPDVILIDGGLGQLHAAIEAFEAVDVKPPMVISLAKKEELIYVQQRSEPIRLGRGYLGLKLCQAIRDEAHRFAQHYHHILRRKRMIDG